VEVSFVRNRLTRAIERARRVAQDRRQRAAETERSYETFLQEVATPVVRMLATALKAEGYLFTVFTPAGRVRLASDKGRDDYIELMIDSTVDPPQVTGLVTYARGSRTVSEEHPLKAGAPPEAITQDDVLEFLLKALEPWLAR
jgi:hypothetical protein